MNWDKMCEYDTFFIKNLQIVCLFRRNTIILHPISIKSIEKMMSMNLINGLIIIRLQGAVGSDKVHTS